MKFSWLTYKIAIRRSFNREYELFSGGMSTTSAWVKQMRHTSALKRRHIREQVARAERRLARK